MEYAYSAIPILEPNLDKLLLYIITYPWPKKVNIF